MEVCEESIECVSDTSEEVFCVTDEDSDDVAVVEEVFFACGESVHATHTRTDARIICTAGEYDKSRVVNFMKLGTE
jgi:hypothetical protein